MAGESQTNALGPDRWITPWTSTAHENVSAAHRPNAAERGRMSVLFRTADGSDLSRDRHRRAPDGVLGGTSRAGPAGADDRPGRSDRCRRTGGPNHRVPPPLGQSPPARSAPAARRESHAQPASVRLRVRRHRQPRRGVAGPFPGAPQRALESGGRDADAVVRGARAARPRQDSSRSPSACPSTCARSSTCAATCPAKIALACDRDTAVTFVNVTRDAASFAREELELLVALFADAYGDRLVRDGASALPVDDDPAARDEMVEVALDALRDPTQRQRLVGFREEQRVLVYFVHARKRTKARARS